MCRYEELPPLDIPVVSFDGTVDSTIPRGYMRQWERYTSGPYRNMEVPGDHYFIASHHRQITREVGQECLGQIERMRGGLLGVGHSWVGGGGNAAPAAGPSSSEPAAPARTDAPAGAVARRPLLGTGLIPLIVRPYQRAASRLEDWQDERCRQEPGAAGGQGSRGLLLLSIVLLLAAVLVQLGSLVAVERLR